MSRKARQYVLAHRLCRKTRLCTSAQLDTRCEWRHGSMMSLIPLPEWRRAALESGALFHNGSATHRALSDLSNSD